MQKNKVTRDEAIEILIEIRKKELEEKNQSNKVPETVIEEISTHAVRDVDEADEDEDEEEADTNEDDPYKKESAIYGKEREGYIRQDVKSIDISKIKAPNENLSKLLNM
jgi:hypothetical protein